MPPGSEKHTKKMLVKIKKMNNQQLFVAILQRFANLNCVKEKTVTFGDGRADTKGTAGSAVVSEK